MGQRTDEDDADRVVEHRGDARAEVGRGDVAEAAREDGLDDEEDGVEVSAFKSVSASCPGQRERTDMKLEANLNMTAPRVRYITKT